MNYRANIFGMKQLGVDSSGFGQHGGQHERGDPPGELVVPNQFIDHTFKRPETFFGDGIVVHVSLADPVCADLATRSVGRDQRERCEDS